VLFYKRSVALCVVFLAAWASAAPPEKFIPAGDDGIEGEYLVIFEDDVLPDQVPDVAREVAAAQRADIQKVWSHAVRGFFARSTEAQARALSHHPRVKLVEQNVQWALSAGSHATSVDPRGCDPLAGACAATADNRLWHLDRIDQNGANPNGNYAYCYTGQGVTVYVVDTGVNKHHNEFAPGGARVQPGYNATADAMRADDPCVGFAIKPVLGVDPYYVIEKNLYDVERLDAAHGTAVAAALGGRRAGIAKDVTIVPIKTARCDYFSARARVSSRAYQQNETMFISRNGTVIDAIYRAQNGGTTAPGTNLAAWPTTAGATFQDGGVSWIALSFTEVTGSVQTTQNIIGGLNWILKPENPGPRAGAIVTMSTYRMTGEASVDGLGNTLERAVNSLLAAGLTVVVSANNQNGNACDTMPARMGRDTAVITAGGSMLVNRPDSIDLSDVTDPAALQADGPRSNGGTYGVEPAYAASQPVKDARWICGKGDSSAYCSNTTSQLSPNPANRNAYKSFNGGSNAGPCVTLFAPAKNLFLAANGSASDYRDARLRGAKASGTSWSAPIVAGVAARLLEEHRLTNPPATPALTPAQVRAALIARTTPSLDASTLATWDHNGVVIAGTENRLLSLSSVAITAQPQSVTGSHHVATPLSVTAAGAVSYQWFKVDEQSGFDYTATNFGAHTSLLIPGATSSTYNVPPSAARAGYWVRVTGTCGTADSRIATIMPPAAYVKGDFNADDRADLVWQNSATGQTTLWLMNGTTYAGEAQLPAVGSGWTIAGADDFNGDGFSDLVWRHGTTFQTVVWLLNGTAYAGEAALPGVSSANWRIAGTGDFNGDGKPDLVWQNASTFQTVVWLLNGTSYTGQVSLPTVSSADWSIRGVGDFDADGDADVVWRNAATFQTVVWLMNGTVYAGEGALPGVSSAAWNIQAVADYNGDGRSDLVWRNAATFQTVVWLLHGTTYAGEAALPGVSSAAWQVVAPR